MSMLHVMSMLQVLFDVFQMEICMAADYKMLLVSAACSCRLPMLHVRTARSC
jgi:hypothetical protein